MRAILTLDQSMMSRLGGVEEREWQLLLVEGAVEAEQNRQMSTKVLCKFAYPTKMDSSDLFLHPKALLLVQMIKGPIKPVQAWEMDL